MNLQETINHLIEYMDLGCRTHPDSDRHAEVEAYLDEALTNDFEIGAWNEMRKTLVHSYIERRRSREFVTIRALQDIIAREDDPMEIADSTKLIKITLDGIDKLPEVQAAMLIRLTR